MTNPKLPPIGFWSYAREDDKRKTLGLLRQLLTEQVQQHYGKDEIKIFQDVAAIPPGAAWEIKMREALNDSSFFIPIVTPCFLESKWCNEEFFIFRERESQLIADFPKLAGESRIFPISYLDTDRVEALNPQLVSELQRSQWLHFYDLVDKEVYSEEVKARLRTLSQSIANLLRRDRAIMADYRTDANADLKGSEERRRQAAEATRAHLGPSMTGSAAPASGQREAAEQARGGTQATAFRYATGERQRAGTQKQRADEESFAGSPVPFPRSEATRKKGTLSASLIAMVAFVLIGLGVWFLLSRRENTTVPTGQAPASQSSSLPQISPAGSLLVEQAESANLRGDTGEALTLYGRACAAGNATGCARQKAIQSARDAARRALEQ